MQRNEQKKQVQAALAPREVLAETFSVCPQCLRQLPAQRVSYGQRIYLEKTCPEHGVSRALIWQGKASYQRWLRQEDNTPPYQRETEALLGCPYDCGICPSHKQEACCVLIELTQRCNQHCNFCFADAGQALPEMTLAEIEGLYDFLLASSPQDPYFLQLSGGEPTLREDLPEIIRLAKAKGFPYLQLNTNGKRLGLEEDYTQALFKAGLDIVFLQFDGTEDAIYEQIRGEPLLALKQRAIENCAKAGLGVVLVVTAIPQINVKNIGKLIDFALANLPKVRGLHFQPVSYFGRFPQAPTDAMRLTIPDLLQAIEAQTDGRIKQTDFIPLVTGNCLCSFHGNFVVWEDGRLEALAQPQSSSCCGCGEDAIVQARTYIGKKWSQSKAKAEGDWVEADFLEWDRFLKQVRTKGFSITGMAFQDCWNLDLARLQKCRVQVATPSHKLIPFCAYNLTDQEGKSLYGRYT